MYALVLGLSLIIRFERVRRQAAVEGERQLQRERIEFSQEIHDTTAQTAYMIGLGIHRARQLAGESNEELGGRAERDGRAVYVGHVGLRRPIDAGHIFEGRELGRVLRSHCASFEKITAVPAGVSQSGTEPTLANETRARLFSIAHNALTNAFLACPARPGRGEAGLRSRPDKAVRLGRRRRASGGLRRARPRLQRHEEGRRADGGEGSSWRALKEEETTITCVVPYQAGARGG